MIAKLDQMIFYGEESLRCAITEYVARYRGARNNRGLESRIIRPQFRDDGVGEVELLMSRENGVISLASKSQVNDFSPTE